MNRSQALLGTAAAVLAGCTTTASGIVLPESMGTIKLPTRKVHRLGQSGPWDFGHWHLQWDDKEPKLLIYYSDKNGTAGVGSIFVTDGGYLDCETGCFMNCGYGVQPPPTFVPWSIPWDNGDKWTPGQIVKLWEKTFFHVNPASESPGGVVYQDGQAMFSWSADLGLKQATHIGIYPNQFTVQYDYNVGGSKQDDISGDCAGKLAGFAGACILAGGLIWTAETGFGALMAAGAILVAVRAGQEFWQCK